MINVDKIIADFVRAAEVAGRDIKRGDITIEYLPAPHIPPSSLPAGKMAVYVFHWGDQCLKVGKIGPKSQARYTSQHYNPKSSNSNLAKSVLKDKLVMGISDIDEHTVGRWIKQHTDRINFLIQDDFGISLLSLLEAFLQCRLKPLEGFYTQK